MMTKKPYKPETFGAMVARLRERAELSQEALMAAVGKGGSQIGQIETGRRRGSVATLDKLIVTLTSTVEEAEAMFAAWAKFNPPSAGDGAALRQRVDDLAGQVEHLTKSVSEMGAAIERLRRRSR